MTPEFTKEILFEYFSGKATVFQKRRIDEWVKESANRELFFSWLCEWERNNCQYTANTEAGLDRHWTKINSRHDLTASNNQKTISLLKSIIGKSKLLVACLVLLCIAMALWLFRESVLYRSYTAGIGEVRTVWLPDSSRVVLNANSNLRVPRFGFGSKIREVHLNGEGDFDVKSLPDKKQFIVKTDQKLSIVVLGTTFNAYVRFGQAKVLLNKGRVELQYQKENLEKQLILQPGELASVNTNGELNIEKVENPDQKPSWRFRNFNFENTSLLEIGKILKESFGTTLIIEDSELEKLTITGSFTVLEAEELLELLCEASGGLKFTRSGKNLLTLQTTNYSF